MTLYLTQPTMRLKSAYRSFYQEWKDSGETIIPWVVNEDPNDFGKMLTTLSGYEYGKNVPVSWIPESSTFWLVDGYEKVIGVTNIRHRLTEELLNAGGHIGYGIRQSEREKGYATTILMLSLEEARKLGIENVLLVCNRDNVASEKSILKNGGRPDADYIDEEGHVLKRYWIKT
ncbi:GNAT family N-acetyltransferase [Salicibibacter cibarius]|uniref:GNAT family N-acetyltransferase n=1 Tax=Salicibibacter cibarius TaxID=2743000 RepID=A0A7T6Z274_9BACI|nr:GNAT family N-acetyltransferase [Salicibibacter cibarius]QQK75327.1 GNAT family N-acetyltransferase [Salicibibacter cibarius]